MDFTQSYQKKTMPYLKIWVLAITLAVMGVAINEYLAAKAEHRHSVVNDADLWALERHKVESLEDSAILLLGASRMQTNIDTFRVRETCTNLPIIQLAMSGRGSPLPAFQDIVKNTNYAGLIILSETEATLISPNSRQTEFVQKYRSGFFQEARWNRQLRSALEQHLRSATPSSSSERLYGNLVMRQRLPYPRHVKTHSDRSQDANFELMEPRLLENIRNPKKTRPPQDPIDHQSWQEQVTKNYKNLIQTFQKRGGQVIFVRMPVDNVRREYEKVTWPKGLFWDKLESALGTPNWHYTEDPALESYSLPDRSHIDEKDKAFFTDNFFYGIYKKLPASIKNTYGCLSRPKIEGTLQ